MAVLGVPGTSSAASAPTCGNPSTEITNDPGHCYVMAVQGAPGGNPSFISMDGTFTVPSHLAVVAPAYSIAQIALSFGAADIELGWMVNPAAYHNQSPHLFVFFRRFEPSYLAPFFQNYCSVGLPGSKSECPSNDYQQLPSNYSAGMAIGGKPAFFYVAYDSSNQFWYIQYQDQYIARMSESWYTYGSACSSCSYKGGDTAAWFGEVYTPNNSRTYRCTPMGNGNYGSGSNSVSVSGMSIGPGKGLVAANPALRS